MNRGTATAVSSNPSKASISPPDEERWMSVVFQQGHEADIVLEMIERTGPETAIRHLSQWDYGDETRDAALVNGYVYAAIPQSATDHVIRENTSMYALTYNHQFGYVSLLRHFTPVVDETPQPGTRPAWSAPVRRGNAGRTTGHRL